MGPEGAAVSVVSTFAGTTQAVIQNPFSNGGSPGAEGGTETRFAWGGRRDRVGADGSGAGTGGRSVLCDDDASGRFAAGDPTQHRAPRAPVLPEAGGAAGPAGRATTSAAQRGRAAPPGQDQQLDRPTVQDHPRLRRRQQQNGGEQRGDPVQGVRLRAGAAAEQPAPAGDVQGGRAAADGQRAAAQTDGRAEERECAAETTTAEPGGWDREQPGTGTVTPWGHPLGTPPGDTPWIPQPHWGPPSDTQGPLGDISPPLGTPLGTPP
ncbi:hypothetical protein Q9966_016463 [Columba livia]|nr:hypothetical protein Q9966_016463 [Columba livia]